MINDPITEPSKPMFVIPPDSPLGKVTLEIISTGLTFENLPISVPHVSEFAAATDARNE